MTALPHLPLTNTLTIFFIAFIVVQFDCNKNTFIYPFFNLHKLGGHPDAQVKLLKQLSVIAANSVIVSNRNLLHYVPKAAGEQARVNFLLIHNYAWPNSHWL